MSLNLYVLVACILTLLPFCGQAQTETTPYSAQGLGNLTGPALVHNLGMGGVGIAAGNGIHLNNVNPALLYRNALTSFNVAFGTEYKDLLKSGETATSFTGGLLYGAFAFPAIANRWTLSVGLMPYSTVGYRVEEDRPIEGTSQSAQLTLEGEGGISQVYFANGVRIYKNFSAGLRLSYLFGTINRDLSLLPKIAGTGQATAYVEEVYHTGVLAEGGLYYSQKIGKTSYLSAGLIYQPESEINATRNVRFESTDPLRGGGVRDTISDQMGHVTIPAKFGAGIAVEKYLKYMAGVDITLHQWENFRAYQSDDQAGPGSNNGMRNGIEIAAGGEYIPDVTSVNSYLKRVTYRAGFNYKNTPFAVNDRQIRDVGASLGMSLPLSNLSSLNLAFEAGRRGTTQDNLIRENYFKVNLGVSFNDRWFIRRKYD